MATRILKKPAASIRVYAEADELALKAARRFARLADQYVVGCGRFTVALSGGSTPKKMYALLADKPFVDTVPWGSIYFFWGDERCVPPDEPESNYRMVYETLLSKVPVTQENIFRIAGEDEHHKRAAKVYSKTIREFFGTDSPRFDLIFLGMGPDGHTASLFPHTEALKVDDKIAVANYVEKLEAFRITLTATSINNARNVTFLVAGEDKAATLKEVLEGPHLPEDYPSQLIQPKDGTLLWMIDEAAAIFLQ